MADDSTETPASGLTARLLQVLLERRVIVYLVTLLIVGWGILVSPFEWGPGWLPHRPVPVDAVPDIGENQQIVFTSWPGRSPRDVEDQITYPLTVFHVRLFHHLRHL